MFLPLYFTLDNSFQSSIFGVKKVQENQIQITLLPVNMVGIGIIQPRRETTLNHSTLISITAHYVANILTEGTFDITIHATTMLSVQTPIRSMKVEDYSSQYVAATSTLSDDRKRSTER